MTTRVIGDTDRPVYAMILAVTLPDGRTEAEVQAALDEVRSDLGVDCTLHPVDPDVL
jgi:hypothetical protein